MASREVQNSVGRSIVTPAKAGVQYEEQPAPYPDTGMVSGLWIPARHGASETFAGMTGRNLEFFTSLKRVTLSSLLGMSM